MERIWLSSCSAGSRGVVLGVAVGAARLDARWIRSEQAAGADCAPYTWAAGLTHGATVTVTTRNWSKHETTIYVLFPFPYLSENVSIHPSANALSINSTDITYPLYLVKKYRPTLSSYKNILFICKCINPFVYKIGYLSISNLLINRPIY